MDLIVRPDESGQKIIKYLLRKSDGTKIFLFKLFRKGQVLVNGRKVREDFEVRDGDHVRSDFLKAVEREAPAVGAAGADPDVLFESGDIVAVDKDDRTQVQPGRRGEASLVEIMAGFMARRGDNADFLVPLHRLDRGTAGVALFAKNYAASKKYSALFRGGGVDKTYLAVLEGDIGGEVFVQADIVREDEGFSRALKLQTAPAVPDKSAWLEGVYKNSSAASATVIRPLERRGGMTLAEITIWTGRHHQIRAVCAALGHPVSGDAKYGARGRGGMKLLAKRIAIKDEGIVIESRRELALP